MSDANVIPAAIDAYVDTPDATTRYRRAGAGAPVLLLRDADVTGGDDVRDPLGAAGAGGGETDRDDLLTTLAAAFRVYAPVARVGPGNSVWCEGAQTPVDGASWLRSLIDALGVDGASVVADAAFAALALGFVRADPYRAGRAVVAGTGEAAVETLARLRAALAAPPAG